MIAVCAKCCLLYETLSKESADEPGEVCSSCWNQGWRPDGAGGIYQLDLAGIAARAQRRAQP